MTALELAGIAVPSIAILAGAVGTVLARNLVHSVFWLALALVSTAGLFVRLGAGFMAGAQVLVYAGGIITLMIFAVMLTTRIEGGPLHHESRGQLRAFLIAGAVCVLLCIPILSADFSAQPAPAPTAADLGHAFLTDFVLPFEVLSVLLVAAMIGAIAIARKVDPSAIDTARKVDPSAIDTARKVEP
jgi:NADH-quinone oxidoreductase subunit J